MTTETLLLLVFVILIIGVFPSWPYSKPWGYAPTGVLALLLAAFLIWAIAGGRPLFSSSGQSVRSTVEEAGQDLKAAGRDVADSVRDAVQ